MVDFLKIAKNHCEYVSVIFLHTESTNLLMRTHPFVALIQIETVSTTFPWRVSDISHNHLSSWTPIPQRKTSPHCGSCNRRGSEFMNVILLRQLSYLSSMLSNPLTSRSCLASLSSLSPVKYELRLCPWPLGRDGYSERHHSTLLL